MAILVCGGAGYIGSHTALALVAAGRDTVVADSLDTGFREAVPEQARFYQGDIRDRRFCDALFERERIDGVIHFAASSLVGESMTAPLRYYDNNLGGTRVLLESMEAHGVRNIVFSSSAAVYGEPERLPILETDGTKPTNCYGETKLAVENMMKWAARAHGMRYAALRYFNACGAQPGGRIGEAHDPETHLIPLILQAASGRRARVFIFGDNYPTPDGTCIRDYVHVCDLAQAHMLALEYLATGGESGAFNLGSGVGFSVRQVVEEARRVTGQPIPTEVRPRRAGDPARLIASSDKARAVLGWKPEYGDLPTILETAWEWHRAHPKGYGV